MRELEGAFCLSRAALEGWVLLWKYGQLNLARHFEVIFHLQVFSLNFRAALRQGGVSATDFLLRHPLLCYIPEDRLQTYDSSAGFTKRGFDDLYEELVASWRLMFLYRFIGLAGFHHTAVIALVLLGHFLREKIKIRFANDFL